MRWLKSRSFSSSQLQYFGTLATTEALTILIGSIRISEKRNRKRTRFTTLEKRTPRETKPSQISLGPDTQEKEKTPDFKIIQQGNNCYT